MSVDKDHAKVVGILDGAEAVEVPLPAAGDDDEAGRSARREARAMGFNIDEMNAEWAVLLLGSKAVILREVADAPLEDRMRFMSIEAFRLWFRNRRTELINGDGEVETRSWADRWIAMRKRRQYSGIEFKPGEGPVTPDYLNLWRGFACSPRKGGSYGVFRDHLLTNVCHGDAVLFDWVFGWFAHIFQKPRERIGTALVLRGAMGSGKTKVGEVFGSLIPAHYFMVDDPRYVTGQFNAHMASCLLLQAEEAVWAGDKAAEGRLKGLVTSKFQMIEQKGVDPIRLDNYVRLVMTSNEDWVVPAGKDERRFCVLDVGNAVAQNHGYFAEMEAELAAGGGEALLADLLAFDISKVNLRQIPKTGALLEQKIRSLDPVEAWWLGRLRDGTPTRQMDVWGMTVSKAALFGDFVEASERAGIKRRGYETEIGMKLHKIIPGLTSRRADVHGDGRRIWCYILPPLKQARDGFEVAVGQAVQWPLENEAPVSPEEFDG